MDILKSIGFFAMFVIGNAVGSYRDFTDFIYWYIPERLWFVLYMRILVVGFAVASATLMGLARRCSRIRSFILVHHHALFFTNLILDSLFFSGLFLTYRVELGLPWAPHAAMVFSSFMLSRVPWWTQTLGSLFQIFAFCVCASVAGYPPADVLYAALYLFLFTALGAVGTMSSEHSHRKLFARQEMSLRVVQRKAHELETLAQRVQAADDAKSKFIANMSHEIRTPLHSVITAMDLLKSSGGGLAPDQEEYVNVAVMSSRLLLDILNNILDVSKLQAGQMQLESKPMNLRTLVDNAAVVFSQIAARKGVEVSAIVPPTCPVHLLSDPISLNQILFNLISNAVKFTEQGSVTIFVSHSEETENEVLITIRVKDTGIGLAKHHFDLLFKRFSQVDGSATRKFQGTGLGLALVSEFAKLFHGSINATSDGPGTGTTLEFSAKFQKDCSPTISIQTSPSSSTLRMKCLALVVNTFRPDVQAWDMYLSALGLDSTIIEPDFPFADLAISVKNKFLSVVAATSMEPFCAPLCIVLDSTLCSHSRTLELLTVLDSIVNELSKSFIPSIPHDNLIFKTCTLFVLVLENPLSPKTSYPELAAPGRHIWSLKKPCRLEKLEQVISSMSSTLEQQISSASQPESLLLSPGGIIRHSSSTFGLNHFADLEHAIANAKLSGLDSSVSGGGGTPTKEILVIESAPIEPHKRVLIVDDNHVNRKLTHKLLSKAGFFCKTAENGLLAVQAVERENFAVIFMDITMPVMDGCTATALIQEQQRLKNVQPRTLICALTAAESDQFSANFDEILAKPVKTDKLIEVANHLSELWRLR